jgi:hypothetical protein
MTKIKILIESVVLGITTVLIGKLISRILSRVNDDNKTLIKKWSEPYLFGLVLFMTGMCIHLLTELGGFNKWYCDKETKKCIRNLSLLGQPVIN